jgi:hypothetical protein
MAVYSSDIIRVMKSRSKRWVGNVARMGALRNIYKIFVGKPEGKRSRRRPMHRWEDIIRMDLGKIGWECVDWIHLVRNWNQ